MYTVFAPNSFPMKINPIIRRNVFKINVNTETCIPNNFDNTRARPETLPDISGNHEEINPCGYKKHSKCND